MVFQIKKKKKAGKIITKLKDHNVNPLGQKKIGQHWQPYYFLWKRVYTLLKSLQQSWWCGKLNFKKWLPRGRACYACSGLPDNSAKMYSDKSKSRNGSWNGIDFKSFHEERYAHWRHLLSVPMHREKINRKKRQKAGGKRWRSQKIRRTSSSRPSIQRGSHL